MKKITLKGYKSSKQGIPSLTFPKDAYKEFLNKLDDYEEVVIEISIKRSLDQNAKFHKLVQIMSEHMGESFEAVKAYLVCKFFGCDDVEIEGRHYTIPVKTSQLSKEEFTIGLTALCQWMEEQQII